jgi:poly-gamma-glutamate synthesis protein (capsule biosynthesis protein)
MSSALANRPATAGAGASPPCNTFARPVNDESHAPGDAAGPGARLFLCGDVMTGRGIDQILPHPGAPELFERWMRSAEGYVELAERKTGPIPRPADFAYPWGDALGVLECFRPAARIINLETAVTASDDAQAGKGIHYRMHPANMPCLASAGIDCCVLANNHVLDWGRAGLDETLACLHRAGMCTAGAGHNDVEAAAPAAMDLPASGRVLVFACATPGSGVPAEWAATNRRAGVNLLAEVTGRAADAIARRTALHKRTGDIVVMSLHWGANWGFDVTDAERAFAHRLIDAAGVDIVHGHSAHHVKGIEVHRGKLILYGCGDFLNDYEGIGGHEAYRPDLTLMYLPLVDLASGTLRELAAVPMQIRGLGLRRAPEEGVASLCATINRESARWGVRVVRQADDTLSWRPQTGRDRRQESTGRR